MPPGRNDQPQSFGGLAGVATHEDADPRRRDDQERRLALEHVDDVQRRLGEVAPQDVGEGDQGHLGAQQQRRQDKRKRVDRVLGVDRKERRHVPADGLEQEPGRRRRGHDHTRVDRKPTLGWQSLRQQLESGEVGQSEQSDEGDCEGREQRAGAGSPGLADERIRGYD